MAIHDLPGVEEMHEQLLQLLHKASQVKNYATIDPPLLKSDFTGDQGIVPLLGHEKFHLTLVEVAARRIFYETVAAVEIDDPEFVRIWNLLDILTICGDQDQCDPALAWWLLEELLDTKSVDECRVVFDYLDSRRTRLIAHYFSKKQLVILRAFNDLLRRVSRAENAVFCGRILTYLFQSFELGGRGAVNHRGEYNVDNVTTFDPHVGVSKSSSSDEDISMADVPNDSSRPEGAEPDVAQETTNRTENTEKTDLDALYPIFWSLQQFFSNPPHVLNSENLQQFKSGLEATLQKFKDVPKIIETTPSGASLAYDRTLDTAGHSSDVDGAYNPKYLTSPDLFELELSDLAFQRDVLVQSLILIEFLQNQTEDMKSAITKMAQSKSQTDFNLSPEDLSWAEEQKKSIGRYLRDGPDGSYYSRMVDTILSRDTNWVRWKANNCPAISKDVVSSKEYQACKEEAKRLCTAKRLRATPMGTLDLRFLSEGEREQSLDRLQASQRLALPTMDVLVKTVGTTELDLDFASGDERDRLESIKESQTWGVLRKGVRTAFSRLDMVDGGRDLRGFTGPDDVEATFASNGVTTDQHMSGTNEDGHPNSDVVPAQMEAEIPQVAEIGTHEIET